MPENQNTDKNKPNMPQKDDKQRQPGQQPQKQGDIGKRDDLGKERKGSIDDDLDQGGESEE